MRVERRKKAGEKRNTRDDDEDGDDDDEHIAVNSRSGQNVFCACKMYFVENAKGNFRPESNKVKTN